MSELRQSFVQHVRTLKLSVAAACRQFGISRKTGYKWLRRFAAAPSDALADRSRRPRRSPRKTSTHVESRVLAIRDQYGWGARKIRAYLLRHKRRVPSLRTCVHILERHGRLHRAPQPAPPPQFFERSAPNQLWQCDFKGPLEIARRRVAPFAVLDDHSRFLLTLHGCLEQTTRSAWELLWGLFEQYGLPEALLCDNFFGCQSGLQLRSLSWFESRLLRLNIQCLHGRPYHPQTQGKIERLNGTLERELWPRVRRDRLVHFNADCEHWRYWTYNLVRPHEALGDLPPVTRYRPSSKARPQRLPALEYPAGALLRRISSVGAIHWKNCRILIGRGLAGDVVRVEQTEHELRVYYAQTLVRRLALNTLKRDSFQ